MSNNAHTQVYVTTESMVDQGKEDSNGKWFDLLAYTDYKDFYAAALSYVKKELAEGNDTTEPHYSEFDICFLAESNRSNNFDTDHLIGGEHLSEDLWFVAKLDDEDRAMLNAFWGACTNLADTMEENFETAKARFIGCFDDCEAFGRHQISKMGYFCDLPDNLEPYFDFAGAGQELAEDTIEYDGYFFKDE